jgi:hypothetical protein
MTDSGQKKSRVQSKKLKAIGGEIDLATLKHQTDTKKGHGNRAAKKRVGNSIPLLPEIEYGCGANDTSPSLLQSSISMSNRHVLGQDQDEDDNDEEEPPGVQYTQRPLPAPPARDRSRAATDARRGSVASRMQAQHFEHVQRVCGGLDLGCGLANGDTDTSQLNQCTGVAVGLDHVIFVAVGVL